MYQANNKQLEELYQLLKDEHQALQLTSNKLEEKLRKTQVKIEILNMVDNFFYVIDFNIHLFYTFSVTSGLSKILCHDLLLKLLMTYFQLSTSLV